MLSQLFRHDLSVDNFKKAVRYPRQAVDATVYELLYRVPLTYLNTLTTIGTNVFSREWDVLVLLDTCRVDALTEVAPEYAFLSDIGSIRSVGGRSPEWIAKTFTEPYRSEIQNTAYLSANVFSKRILDPDYETPDADSTGNITYRLLNDLPTVDVSQLGRFEYLYKYEPVGEEGPRGHVDGGTPPRYVTDRAISIGRDHDFDRLILHYLQPHPPYVANAIDSGRELKQYESDWWGYLGDTGDYETIWNTYLDELRYVLDDVELLLDNIDAETVVISADHGEAFGEYLEFGHKTGSLNPTVRRVPWVETTASDTGSYVPSTEPPTAVEESEATDNLAALGYKM